MAVRRGDDKRKMENTVMDEVLRNKLIELYIEDPSGSQPTALWKVFEMFDDVEYEIENNKNDMKTIQLRVHNKDTLITYYHNEEKPYDGDNSEYDLVLLNEKYILDSVSRTNYTRYFKKVYEFGGESEKTELLDYMITNVDLNNDIDKIVEFINSCYIDISVSKDEVLSWCRRKTFSEELWIWIKDIKTGMKIGLGIAEFDEEIAEGILEWIQVHSDYRKRGIGTILVKELQHRLADKADFITVAGKIDDESRPDRLYEACGFKKESKWRVHRR